MLVEQEVQETPAGARNPWAEPFAESRILTGFLRPEDVAVVYPASREWPEEVHARLRPLYGASVGLPPRPDAGRCRLHPVEEPEALAVLHQMTLSFQPPAESPVSYAWVEVENLIAPLAVASPLPRQVAVFNNDPTFLAAYSLYGPSPEPAFGPGGETYTHAPVKLRLAHQGVEDGFLVCRYQYVPVPQPIVVGCEAGRFYLLNEYGKVLQAMIGGVGRLLCLVHYSLDLGAAKMGLWGIEPPGGVANHFGRALLSGDCPPAVKDFLDNTLAAAVPSRAVFYITRPSVQTTAVNFTPVSPSDQLPLESGR